MGRVDGKELVNGTEPRMLNANYACLRLRNRRLFCKPTSKLPYDHRTRRRSADISSERERLPIQADLQNLPRLPPASQQRTIFSTAQLPSHNKGSVTKQQLRWSATAVAAPTAQKIDNHFAECHSQSRSPGSATPRRTVLACGQGKGGIHAILARRLHLSRYFCRIACRHRFHLTTTRNR